MNLSFRFVAEHKCPALLVINEYALSVFVPDTPGKQGIHSDVRQLTGSMGISPLRGSHRAAFSGGSLIIL